MPQCSDLGGNARVHLLDSLLVDTSHLLLNLECTLLTLVDGIGNSGLDAIVVGFLDLLEVGTASDILDGILLDDTGEVEDLLVVLLGELVDSGVETCRPSVCASARH